MRIPYERLSDEALRAILEEVVTRDGTELTEAGAKVEQLRRRLERGEAEIQFDEETGTCNVVAVE